jgi:ketosteroid isomerase-like protein
MHRCRLFLLFSILLWPLASSRASDDGTDSLEQQVERTERAFAQTMADRDFEAFQTFLDPETVFFSGDEPLRGSAVVAERWQPYFESPAAPFSWRPESVQVLDSGHLAFSSGPVHSPSGERVATFHSVWRRDSDGEWKIVFDKGSTFCE